MSKAEIQSITCEGCNKEQEFHLYHSVNVTMEPAMKEKVLSKELFEFTCNSCGYKAMVVHDFMYHDMNKKLIIQFLAKGGKIAPEYTTALSLFAEQGYKIRIVGSMNELIEKVIIFESGLKDTAIEVLKATIILKEEEKGTPVDAVFFTVKEKNDQGVEGIYFVAIREKGEPSHLSFNVADIKNHLETMPHELAKWPDLRSMVVNYKTIFPKKEEDKK